MPVTNLRLDGKLLTKNIKDVLKVCVQTLGNVIVSNQWDYDTKTYWQIWNRITIVAEVINPNQPRPQPFCLFRKFETHWLWCLEPAHTSCRSSSSPSSGASISGGPREEAQGSLEIREPFANTLCLWSFNSKPKYQGCCDWGNSLKLSIEEAKVLSRKLGEAPEACLPPVSHTHLGSRAGSNSATQRDRDASRPVPPQPDPGGEKVLLSAGEETG